MGLPPQSSTRPNVLNFGCGRVSVLSLLTQNRFFYFTDQRFPPGMLGGAWGCLGMLGDAWRCLEMLGDALGLFGNAH